MKNFLVAACGGAVGTLLYTALRDSAHQPDWARAAVVGIMVGVCSILWSRREKKR